MWSYSCHIPFLSGTVYFATVVTFLHLGFQIELFWLQKLLRTRTVKHLMSPHANFFHTIPQCLSFGFFLKKKPKQIPSFQFLTGYNCFCIQTYPNLQTRCRDQVFEAYISFPGLNTFSCWFQWIVQLCHTTTDHDCRGGLSKSHDKQDQWH